MKLEIFGPFKARYGKLIRETRLLHTVFDTVPTALLIIDEDMRVLFANGIFLSLLAREDEEVAGRSFGEVVGCLCDNCTSNGQRLCPNEECTRCGIRNSLRKIFSGELESFAQDVILQKDGREMDLRMSAGVLNLEGSRFALVSLLDLTSLRELERRLAAKNTELEETVVTLENTLKEIKTLQALLPMCSNCKRVRDDKNYWQDLEEYLAERSGTIVSHSLCPDCLRTLYPQIAKEMDRDNEET